jgi:hypothetical protein
VTYRPPPLREALALAYLAGLAEKAPQLPVTGLREVTRLDDTGRAPLVPLRAARG